VSLRDLTDGLVGRLRGRSPEPPRLELPPVRTSEQLVADLDAFEDSLDNRVPAAVESRVTKVVSIVRETIPRLDQLGGGSYQAHSVVATATSYLPEAVGAYLRLPRQWADSRPVSGGKTSLMVLCDQLDLLGYKMGEVFDAVCRADAEALVAHGAFLAEKFGTGGALDLGEATGSAQQPADPSAASASTSSGPDDAGRLRPPGAS
jgi:hypothetical protein